MSGEKRDWGAAHADAGHLTERRASFGIDYWVCRVCGRRWDDAPPSPDAECPVAIIGVQAKCTDCDLELSALGADVAHHVITTAHKVTTRHVSLRRPKPRAAS